MILQYKHLIPENFHDTSRVWIYQANRNFSPGEVVNVQSILQQFVSDWNSHGATVKGFATIIFDRFIVLMADETGSGVSGCSTDSSVRVIKNISEQYHIDLFDRTGTAFFIDAKVEVVPLNNLKEKFEDGTVTSRTLYFNNTIQNKSGLLNNWIIPTGESWLAKRFAGIASIVS
jgi:hypothetical protein